MEVDPYHKELERGGVINLIDVFIEDQQFKARISLADKDLPIKIFFNSKKHKDQVRYDKSLPEDLKIYMS